MSQKLTVALALAAGLLGGLLSRYIAPTSVSAQTMAPMVGEIRGQSFVFVDGKNNVLGKFTVDRSQPPGSGRPPAIVVLLDADGHEIWRAGTSIHPLGTR
jgi:hypothetical protein